MSAFTDFETESAVPDWPLVGETGVGGMEDGFCSDEAVALGLGDLVPVQGES